MANPRVRITKRLIDAIVATGVEQNIRDSEVLGFALRVSPTGQISYVLRYWIDGLQRRYKIGIHGAPWCPETARAEAQILLGKIAEGIDPQQIKLNERKDLTIGELCDIYLDEGLLTAKSSSVTSARKDIENHIKPRVGRRRASKFIRAARAAPACGHYRA